MGASSRPGWAWCRGSTARVAKPGWDASPRPAGDAYLRSLLVLGARAVLNAAAAKRDSLSRWACALRERRGYWKAVVAIAAKNARMAWAVLTKGESFKLPA